MSTAVDHAPEAGGTPRAGKRRMSDRARGERNLGWMLSAPAFLIMIGVTLFPILYALYNSLFRFRLTDPDLEAYAADLGIADIAQMIGLGALASIGIAQVA